MNKEIRDAYARREDPSTKLTRIAYARTVELWLRSIPQDEDTLKKMWPVLTDNAALFATQADISKEKFLEWCAESYELYSRILKVAGPDPDKVMELVRREIL